jgi:hypothetical protein
LVAPRSQWRTLASWSVADAHASEPGAASYGIRRLFCGIGALGVAAVLSVASASSMANMPQPPPPATPLEVMWGSPAPSVVNRFISPLPAPPGDVVEAPVIGYQAFEDGTPPHYLGLLKPYSRLGETMIPGYIGRIPDEGYSAADFAELVVHVRVPILCMPRAAVVAETEDTVTIAIYYGLPNSSDGSPVDHAAGCDVDSFVTASLLIPIDLAAPVGKREIVTLDGEGINQVLLVE